MCIRDRAEAAGWLTDATEATHVAFGSVLGEDNKLMKSRSGESLKLSDLLDEAVARAAAIVEEISDRRAMMLLMSPIAAAESRVADWMPPICWPISPVAFAVCSASAFIVKALSFPVLAGCS